MKRITVKKQDNRFVIGDSPCLVLDLENQNHYIETEETRIPYRVHIDISPDLLEGKRENVLQTVANYYYEHACQVADGVEIAAKYRKQANSVTREVQAGLKKKLQETN